MSTSRINNTTTSSRKRLDVLITNSVIKRDNLVNYGIGALVPQEQIEYLMDLVKVLDYSLCDIESPERQALLEKINIILNKY